jgi:hypothetical protein
VPLVLWSRDNGPQGPIFGEAGAALRFAGCHLDARTGPTRPRSIRNSRGSDRVRLRCAGEFLGSELAGVVFLQCVAGTSKRSFALVTVDD